MLFSCNILTSFFRNHFFPPWIKDNSHATCFRFFRWVWWTWKPLRFVGRRISLLSFYQNLLTRPLWTWVISRSLTKTLRKISIVIRFRPPSFNHPFALTSVSAKVQKVKTSHFHKGRTLFLSQLLKHETQMVCKCPLWFCLMFLGCKVQRMKQPSPLSL